VIEITTIAIVGTTNLGLRIAHAALIAGYRTILEDVSTAALERGIEWIAKALGEDAAAGRIASAARDAALANLSTANSAEDAAREADLIIETVADEMEMKIELFTIFDKFAKPGAIFASSTTLFSVSDLADVTFCPERCIGMRFFAGAENTRRLELVKGRETSEETIAACREVCRRMGLQVSVLSDERATPRAQAIEFHSTSK
jgi:3-hydroxybutyryl-CoA dehydrogenase